VAREMMVVIAAMVLMFMSLSLCTVMFSFCRCLHAARPANPAEARLLDAAMVSDRRVVGK
jgi:hypothetical protein